MSHGSAMSAAGVLNPAPNMVDVGTSTIAYWKVGGGPSLLLVHGYPVSGRTWRHVVAQLASDFTCYVVDLPGAGETRWTDRTDFSFAGQARTLLALWTLCGSGPTSSWRTTRVRPSRAASPPSTLPA